MSVRKVLASSLQSCLGQRRQRSLANSPTSHLDYQIEKCSSLVRSRQAQNAGASSAILRRIVDLKKTDTGCNPGPDADSLGQVLAAILGPSLPQQIVMLYMQLCGLMLPGHDHKLFQRSPYRTCRAFSNLRSLD